MKTAILILTATAAALPWYGCAAKATPPPAGEIEATLNPPPAETAPAPSAAKPDGAALLETRCSTCHPSHKVNTTKTDVAGWRNIINAMVKKGAQLSEEEAAILAQYLAAQR